MAVAASFTSAFFATFDAVFVDVIFGMAVLRDFLAA
jgi:hypothetical protein